MLNEEEYTLSLRPHTTFHTEQRPPPRRGFVLSLVFGPDIMYRYDSPIRLRLRLEAEFPTRNVRRKESDGHHIEKLDGDYMNGHNMKGDYILDKPNFLCYCTYGEGSEYAREENL